MKKREKVSKAACILFIAALLLATQLSGCGDSIVPGTLYETVVTADLASDYFQDLCNADQWPAESASLLEYVQGLEEVATARMDDDNETFVIEYRSGVLHFLYCEPKEQRTEDEESAAETARDNFIAYGFPNVTAADPPPATAACFPVPGRLGRSIRSACGNILRAFEAAGYAISGAGTGSAYTPQEPGLDWFRSWNQKGLIYVNGHGGTTTYADTGQSINYVFTNTVYSGAAQEGNLYQEDIDAHRLEFGTGAYSRNLVVTPSYFDHYFADTNNLPNSIIYLDTCHSLDTSVDHSIATSLINNGAELVLGWTGRVERSQASETAALFFDRLCGLSLVDADDLVPPTRPFTALQVYQYLDEAGRTHQARPPADLRYQQRQMRDTQTAALPIINGGYYLVATPAPVYTPAASIHLTGYFGPTEGEVLLDGQPLAEIVHWEETEIVAYAPGNAAGDVAVRVNNLTSNPMRLTRFSGSASWAVNKPGFYSGSISAEFSGRVLLQLMRHEIDGPAETATFATWDTALLIMEEGSATWDISGEWDDDEGNHHSLAAQGSGSIMTQENIGEGAFCEIMFDLGTDNSSYKLYLLAFPTGIDTVTTPEGATREEEWRQGFGTGGLLPSQGLPETWVVPSGTHTGENCVITWNAISPDTTPAPPDDDSAYHGRRRP